MKRARKHRKRHLLPGPAGLLMQQQTTNNRNSNTNTSHDDTTSKNINANANTSTANDDNDDETKTDCTRARIQNDNQSTKSIHSNSKMDGFTATEVSSSTSSSSSSSAINCISSTATMNNSHEVNALIPMTTTTMTTIATSSSLYSQIWDAMCISLNRILPPLPPLLQKQKYQYHHHRHHHENQHQVFLYYLLHLRQSLSSQYTLLSEIIHPINNNHYNTTDRNNYHEKLVIPKIVIQFHTIYSHHGHCDYTVELLDESILYLMTMFQQQQQQKHQQQQQQPHQQQHQPQFNHNNNNTNNYRIMAWLSQSLIKNYPQWIKPGVVLLCRDVSLAIFGDVNQTNNISANTISYNNDNNNHQNNNNHNHNHNATTRNHNSHNHSIDIEKMLLIGEENVIYAWEAESIHDISHSQYIQLIEDRVQMEMKLNHSNCIDIDGNVDYDNHEEDIDVEENVDINNNDDNNVDDDDIRCKSDILLKQQQQQQQQQHQNSYSSIEDEKKMDDNDHNNTCDDQSIITQTANTFVPKGNTITIDKSKSISNNDMKANQTNKNSTMNVLNPYQKKSSIQLTTDDNHIGSKSSNDLTESPPINEKQSLHDDNETCTILPKRQKSRMDGSTTIDSDVNVQEKINIQSSNTTNENNNEISRNLQQKETLWSSMLMGNSFDGCDDDDDDDAFVELDDDEIVERKEIDHNTCSPICKTANIDDKNVSHHVHSDTSSNNGGIVTTSMMFTSFADEDMDAFEED